MRRNRGNILGAASRSQLVPICLTLCRVGEQQLLTRGQRSSAPAILSARERTYTYTTHVDDDNHGKTGCQWTRVHRNSAREDVNGETGRNTRCKPKITVSSCMAVAVANVCARGFTSDIIARERAVLRAEVDLASCDSRAITSARVNFENSRHAAKLSSSKSDGRLSNVRYPFERCTWVTTRGMPAVTSAVGR
jgi:hypothetical protein